MVYLIFLFIIACFILVFSSISGIVANQSQIRQRLPAPEAGHRKPLDIIRYLKPLLGLSNVILKKLNLKERISQRLYAARIKLTPAEFFSVKFIIMIALAGVTYLIFNSVVIPAMAVGVALGYFLPELWLTKKIAKRKQIIARQLPETVDLLGLCMEAGLDFTMSMEWIVKKTRNNPMLEEMAFVLEEIKWGKPRLQALKDMARRLDFPEIRSFVHTLSQAERMGTPVVEVLTMLSEDARMQRSQRGERIALQAPLKMLIPLIFCILPVIGIVIAGPIILQFMQGGMFKGF
jgi:tight adherence protein C